VEEPVTSADLYRFATGRRAYGNLKDAAVEFLRDAIVTGTLPAGSKIDQDDVAGALGVSKAPVREALIELDQKGFVRAVPRRGAFVAEVTVEDIEDHYAVVALVSGMTAGRAVERLTPDDLDELRRLDREIDATDDDARRRSLDRRFFSVVARAGKSPRLDAILGFLGGALQGSFYYDAPGWPANEQDYRRRLLAAIGARDAEAAVRTSEEHVRACAGLAVAHLRARGYWS
jgi:DNA-binding GntR family transcriptional regulator